MPALSRLRRVVTMSRRHGFWILAWSIVGWVGTALAPALADKPFLLMLLSPRALFVAMASDSVSIVPFVVLGTIRLSITDASYYLIGRRFPSVINADTVPSTKPVSRTRSRFRRVGTELNRLCRFFCARPKLAGAFLFFRPNGKYLGLAGAYGVNSWVAGLSATLGTATFLAALHIGAAALF